MVIDYPVFAQDKDKWMYMINSESELGFFESIDIDGREYVGWDAKGLPIEFYTSNRDVGIRVLSEEPQLGMLREAILCYAAVAKPDVPFRYSGSESNIGELFDAVERHVGRKRGHFLGKWRR